MLSNHKVVFYPTFPVWFIYICCTYINTHWTKPNDAAHFDLPITIRKRANYVAGGICRLFVYYAMRQNLCSSLAADQRGRHSTKTVITRQFVVHGINCLNQKRIIHVNFRFIIKYNVPQLNYLPSFPSLGKGWCWIKIWTPPSRQQRDQRQHLYIDSALNAFLANTMHLVNLSSQLSIKHLYLYPSQFNLGNIHSCPHKLLWITKHLATCTRHSNHC